MAYVLPLRSERTGVVTYRVRFRINGTQRQETFPDPDSAHEFRNLVELVGGVDALKVLEARRQTDMGVPTLAQWTAQYLDPDSGLLMGVEPGTRAGYATAAERSFLQVLGHYPVDAIGKVDVGKWLAWQEKQPSKRTQNGLVAPKTIKNYHGILSQVLAAAVAQNLRSDNPAYGARLSKGLRREPVFLSPDEFSTLLYFIPPYYERFVFFLAHTGTRWGEATAVTWGDLNAWSNPPTVRINKAWKKADGGPVLKHPKSRAANRTISLAPDVVAALGKPGAAGDLIFAGRESGNHMWYGRFRTTVWNKAVAKAMDAELCEREGLIPLTVAPRIHDLRHSHASWLIADGVNLPSIQRRLGHESIQTTVNVYGHLESDAHLIMADAMQRRLAGTRHIRPLELTV